MDGETDGRTDRRTDTGDDKTTPVSGPSGKNHISAIQMLKH